jgi:hypothetical protein
VTWCDRCAWNVDPHPKHQQYLRLQLLRQSSTQPQVVLTADLDEELRPAPQTALAALRQEL